MVRLFRMYRFCALVKKEIYAQNTENGGAIRAFLLEFEEDPHYIKKQDAIDQYRPRFSRKSKPLLAEEIYSACITNGYLLEPRKDADKITLSLAHNGGVDLTSGLGFGYIKELLRVNNHFMTLLIAILALAISIMAYLKAR